MTAATLDESARRAGSHRWTESALFGLLGGWVPSTPEPAAKLLLDRHSQHHSWRAAQWWDRLPVLADVDREELTAAPPGPFGPALDAAAAVEGSVARLAVAYRVLLPRLWAAYRSHGAVAGPVADGATRRTLAIVTSDLESDWREGETVLQELVDATAGGAALAASAVGAIEALWGGTGPAPG